MNSDPVIAEIRQTRARLSQGSGGTIRAYAERIRELEKELRMNGHFRFTSGSELPFGNTEISLKEGK